MSNSLSAAWVKNVYSLRIGSGMNRGYSTNSYTPPISSHAAMWVQSPIFTQVLATLSAVLPTRKITSSYLLNRWLYPLSTVPTIKRTKE